MRIEVGVEAHPVAAGDHGRDETHVGQQPERPVDGGQREGRDPCPHDPPDRFRIGVLVGRGDRAKDLEALVGEFDAGPPRNRLQPVHAAIGHACFHYQQLLLPASHSCLRSYHRGISFQQLQGPPQVALPAIGVDGRRGDRMPLPGPDEAVTLDEAILLPPGCRSCSGHPWSRSWDGARSPNCPSPRMRAVMGVRARQSSGVNRSISGASGRASRPTARRRSSSAGKWAVWRERRGASARGARSAGTRARAPAASTTRCTTPESGVVCGRECSAHGAASTATAARPSPRGASANRPRPLRDRPGEPGAPDRRRTDGSLVDRRP